MTIDHFLHFYILYNSLFSPTIISHLFPVGWVYTLYDLLFVYFNNDENKITSIVAKGNVRIVKGDNETRGQEACYDVSTQELTMMGRPTVLFYGEDDNASFGD